mgnify:CR=1 FL=1
MACTVRKEFLAERSTPATHWFRVKHLSLMAAERELEAASAAAPVMEPALAVAAAADLVVALAEAVALEPAFSADSLEAA